MADLGCCCVEIVLQFWNLSGQRHIPYSLVVYSIDQMRDIVQRESRYQVVLGSIQEARGLKLDAWGQGRIYKQALRLQVHLAKVKNDRDL